MHHVRQENLPLVGSSHEFVGAEQGATSVSVFLFHGKPGSGPGQHRHPYDEIQFVREGRGVWTVRRVRSIVSRQLVTRRWTSRRAPQSSLHPREPVESRPLSLHRASVNRRDAGTKKPK